MLPLNALQENGFFLFVEILRPLFPKESVFVVITVGVECLKEAASVIYQPKNTDGSFVWRG